MKNLLAPLALLLLTTLVYLPGLSGDFLFDDYPVILSNPALQPAEWNTESTLAAASAFNAGGLGRQLASLSFAANFSIHGKTPFGFKLTNLILHLLNALLIWRLTQRLFRWQRTKQQLGHWAALGIALAWAIHPLQVSSVLYVVQRMEILALSFVLVGMLLYLRGREQQLKGDGGWAAILLSFPVAALGLLSKETAALYAVYILLLEWALLRCAAHRDGTAQALKVACASTVLLGILAFVGLIVPVYTDPAQYAARDFDLIQRLLSQAWILPMYLTQILAPLPELLTFYYDQLAAPESLLDPPKTLAGLILLAVLAATAIKVRRDQPLLALGIALFFGAHVLTSNIIPLELAYEHRNYFALFGIVLAVASLIDRIPTQDGPAIKRTGILAVMAGLGFLCAVRAATWGNGLLLATDLAEKNPDSPRAANDLATIYAGMADGNPNSPFYAFAIAEFERSAKLPRASALPEHALILTATHVDAPVKVEWWNGLIHKLETRPIDPATLSAVVGLVARRNESILLDDNRLAAAYTALCERVSYQLRPTYLTLFADHARQHLRDRSKASRLYLAAVDQSHNNPAFVSDLILHLFAIDEGEYANLVVNHAGNAGILVAPEESKRLNQ